MQDERETGCLIFAFHTHNGRS